jgi:hypothetical protein
MQDKDYDNSWEKSSDMHEVLIFLSKEKTITKDDYKDLILKLNQEFKIISKNRRKTNGD